MSNIPLQTIKFPGLENIYTISQTEVSYTPNEEITEGTVLGTLTVNNESYEILGSNTTISYESSAEEGSDTIEIGTLTINGEATPITIPDMESEIGITADTTTTTELPVLFAPSASPGTALTSVNYNTGVTVIPSKGVLMGAAWNDFAEYRVCYEKEIISGKVVCETGKDSVAYSTERLQFAPAVISDTFGFAIGDRKSQTVPISVAGKVLVYTDENPENYKLGDVFCAGPNGFASKMTREEIKEYPDRILGYFVGIPKEEYFNDVKINNRIWIRIK